LTSIKPFTTRSSVEARFSAESQGKDFYHTILKRAVKLYTSVNAFVELTAYKRFL